MNGKLYIAIIGVLVAVGFASSASIGSGNSHLQDITCQNNDNFLHYDPESCSMYYECVNGQLQHKSCGFGRKFDEISNKCTIVWWVFGSADCSKVDGNGGVSTTTTTASPTNPNSGPTKPTETPNGPTTATTAKPSSAAISSISATLGMILLAANRAIV